MIRQRSARLRIHPTPRNKFKRSHLLKPRGSPRTRTCSRRWRSSRGRAARAKSSSSSRGICTSSLQCASGCAPERGNRRTGVPSGPWTSRGRPRRAFARETDRFERARTRSRVRACVRAGWCRRRAVNVEACVQPVREPKVLNAYSRRKHARTHERTHAGRSRLRRLPARCRPVLAASSRAVRRCAGGRSGCV